MRALIEKYEYGVGGESKSFFDKDNKNSVVKVYFDINKHTLISKKKLEETENNNDDKKKYIEFQIDKN